MKFFLILAISSTWISCATSFTGSSKFKNGKQTCEKKCSKIDLEMTNFIFVGEYSEACVCGKKNQQSSVGGSSGAVVAAETAIRAAREAARQQHTVRY